MNSVFLLLPDFLLILLGFVLSRFTPLDRPIWESAEKLVYYVLFPALLFSSINKTTFDWGGTSTMLVVAGTGFLSAVALSFLALWLFKPTQKTWASGFQTGFRFNSYIAFAAAGRLTGEEGVALMAITVGCFVPLANMFAVWALAKHSDSHLLKELSRNPLILATVTGLLSNFLGLQLPEFLALSLSRLGAASIALGLLSVGAGLIWVQNKKEGVLIAYWSTIKLLITPGLVLVLGKYLELPPVQLTSVVLFAGMPTATSAYVLAHRMGGDGGIVAVCISVMTMAASITLPLWLLLI